MPIVQVPLDIPDDIYKDLLNGSLNLFGLVKDNQHRIRRHIPKAKLVKSDEIKENGFFQVVKQHRVAAIFIVATVTVAGISAYVFHNFKEGKIDVVEEKALSFQKALKEYLKASKKGKLNTRVVENLLAALDELEKEKLGKNIELIIPAAQLKELIFSIFTYTESLAHANSFEIKIVKPKLESDGTIENLKSYLEIQKQILESAA
ncbi:MAG: hypothetical protein OSJ73_23265 [Lachnospiraceae bacterium]|nr:hypothetical protein [Lachnospiraceae bacterium]